MNRPFVLVSALAAVLTSLAAPTPSISGTQSGTMGGASSTVDQAFGNTIVSTYPDGRQAELWLQADGSYKAEGRRGDPSSGHWRVKGDRLCLHQSHPVPSPFGYCTNIPAAGMNTSWPAKAVTGEKITVRLAHGHVSRPATKA